MAKAIAVVTSDLHLEPKAWVKHPSLSGDSYYGLRQIVDYCVSEQLPLFLAGDVFDKTRHDPATVSVANDCIDLMAKHNLPVYYTQGQHELDRNNPWLSALRSWPQHIHRKTVQVGGHKFYGIDWMPADAIQAEFADIPADTDVLVAHQVWKDLMGPRIGESECQFSDVPHVKVMITGDFHKHLNLTATNKQCKTMTVLSPGSICMQSIDEDPHKQFFVLCDNLTAFSVSLKTRNCLRFVLGDKFDLETFLLVVDQAVMQRPDVPENIAKNIIHVMYHDDIPEAYARITNAVANRGHLFLSPTKHKQAVVSVEIEKRRALADGGLTSCLELLVDKNLPIYSDLMSLLTSSNPYEQLAAIREAFIARRRK